MTLDNQNYGPGGGGTVPTHSAPTPPAPTAWTPQAQGAGDPLPAGSTPAVPTVPSYGSGDKGDTVVNAKALTQFAANIGQLVQAVKPQIDRLSTVDLAPGGFSQADAMKSKVGGSGGTDAGLAQQFSTTLNQLVNGLLDLQNGMTTIAGMYTKADNATKVTADDLNNTMSSAVGDFNSVVKLGS